ncbi:tRNA epoxyqueuosine(34) reductase QueG [Adhaeretor mobilis]|uniref:Epoxyqueuosine reductase n=1 Tax=Adhaeretor mobilis TaxID=1930276 RepID=A0A517MXC2_9BACT|nr:tRNA epoxyqueuosine(34) reductase QueG [Adhaeretor mobilis]QDS99530.1 Epoxyqueuosine reductase [Adhaeretor mobilis]
MTPEQLSTEIKKLSSQLGFALCGVTPAVEPPGATRLGEWLARDYAGDMHYLEERQEAYRHPKHVLDGARSLVMLGMHYRTAQPIEPAAGQGRVSCYAWGTGDYHDLIRKRLHELSDQMRDWSPESQTRGVVDTAPLLEREFAQLAGLGWVGKHTLLINRAQGSYFFLAAVLTDAVLAYDSAFETDHCGSCTACLDACPTGAFPQPYVLDASRCISYLTIEHRSAMPRELRAGIGDWLFGCDVCQDVCPWNRRSPITEEPAFQPLEAMNPIELAELFDLDEASFRQRFRKTPLWRPHRRGLLRNAAMVLGNQKRKSTVPALIKGLSDEESLVRGACAWALGQISSQSAQQALNGQLAIETEETVIQEIRSAL